MTGHDWRARAECRDEPTSTFFVVNGHAAARARRICARCEVADECLAYALSFPWAELHGIWAGTGMHTRRKLRRSLGLAELPLRKDTTE